MGRRRRRSAAHRPHLVALALVVALVVGSSACSDDEDEGSPSTTTAPSAADPGRRTPVLATDLGPFYVSKEPMAGPGTPLGGGFEVPDGALLLGVPFPDLEAGGYRALLLVTGDPVEVYNAFGDQAGERGMEREGACFSTGALLGCGGRFVDGADGESLRVDLTRRVGDEGVVSGVGVRYQPPGSAGTEEVATTSPVLTTPLQPVALPPRPILAPDDGDVGRLLRAPGSPPRSVELGSRLVGLPGPCGCSRGGWSFVVRLTGVHRDVVAAYGRQLSDLGDPPDIADRQRQARTLMGLRVGSGDRVGEVRAVVTDDGADYALVTLIGS